MSDQEEEYFSPVGGAGADGATAGESAADPILIPPEQLSDTALAGLIEEFINREGTDYGAVEWSLEQKASQLRVQLKSGAAVIVFDLATETCSIVSRDAVRGLE